MIHILIERHIANNMDSTYDNLALSVLQKSHVAPGFISGEAFTDTNNSSHRYLFCKWRTARDWQQWFKSRERLEIINKFSSVLEQPEKITILKS